MIEVEWIPFPEIQRILSALGTEPEAVFTTEDVDVGLSGARADGGPADPSEAGGRVAACGARHDAALILRRYDNLSASRGLGEHDDIRILPEKGQVSVEWPWR
jgi:hypothetical protein